MHVHKAVRGTYMFTLSCRVSTSMSSNMSMASANVLRLAAFLPPRAAAMCRHTATMLSPRWSASAWLSWLWRSTGVSFESRYLVDTPPNRTRQFAMGRGFSLTGSRITSQSMLREWSNPRCALVCFSVWVAHTRTVSGLHTHEHGAKRGTGVTLSIHVPLHLVWHSIQVTEYGAREARGHAATARHEEHVLSLQRLRGGKRRVVDDNAHGPCALQSGIIYYYYQSTETEFNRFYSGFEFWRQKGERMLYQ